jgi:hypothetical protein
MIAFLQKLFGPDPRLCGGVRSSKWPAARELHLKMQPTCANCGGQEDLNVHHIVPFQLDASLELEPTNLITLCEGHGCHFAVGHLFNWKSWNRFVCSDAAQMNWRVANRPEK